MNSMRRYTLVKFILGVAIFFIFYDSALYAQPDLSRYNVLDFGAKGNGNSYDTEAIQKAIDAAVQDGGGTVIFPAGQYLTKTIILKDHITIDIRNGAVILGSKEMHDYLPDLGSFKDSGGRKFGAAIFFAADAKNITIEGDGTIDGQGYSEYYPADGSVARPSIIRFFRCKNVKIKDVTLINSAAWVSHYVECEDLLIRGVTIRSYSNKNNDGIDLVGCQRVMITECNIDTEDDSIVLKALTERSCEDIVINNCIVSGLKSAIKTGTESLGGFENITISNCTFYGTRGISLLTVDGGILNNVTISNISMRDTYAVIVMRLGERMRTYGITEDKQPSGPGKISNVSINNIQAINVTESNDFISGIPGHYIENVILSNIRIQYKGGGKKEDSDREIPELIDEYPKARMFGTLPSYGLYIRHAKNITMNNIHYRTSSNDNRSVIICADVQNLIIDGLHASSAQTAAPFIQLIDCHNAEIRHCKPLNPINTFLYGTGHTQGVILIYNDLWQCKNKAVMENTTVADPLRLIK